MYRRTLLIAVLLGLVLAPRPEKLAQAAVRLDVPTIKRALQVTEKENRGFVERVVGLMNKGRLSRKSVTIAFWKATKRTRHKFQYFKAAMIYLAAREGVKLK